MQKKEFNTVEDFISFYFDYWQLVNLPENLRVKGREREYMILMMIMHAKNMNMRDNVDYIYKKMKFKSKREVYTYRSKLTSKGFIEDNKRLPKSLALKKLPSHCKFVLEVANTAVVEKVKVKRTIPPQPLPKKPQRDLMKEYSETVKNIVQID